MEYYNSQKTIPSPHPKYGSSQKMEDSKSINQFAPHSLITTKKPGAPVGTSDPSSLHLFLSCTPIKKESEASHILQLDAKH